VSTFALPNPVTIAALSTGDFFPVDKVAMNEHPHPRPRYDENRNPDVVHSFSSLSNSGSAI
jgi:hypothetical protein